MTHTDLREMVSPNERDGAGSRDRRWLALAVIVMAQFMVVLDVAIVNVALPTIKTDLHFSQESLQWIGGEKPVGTIVTDLAMSQPQVSKHLRVLSEVGLVSCRAEGRQRLYRLEPARLRQMHQWLARYEQAWQERSFRGTYLEVEPPTRTVATWLFEGWPDAHAVESADLHETDGVTTLTMKLVFRDQSGRDHMTTNDGQEDSFNKLEDYLRSLVEQKETVVG